MNSYHTAQTPPVFQVCPGLPIKVFQVCPGLPIKVFQVWLQLPGCSQNFLRNLLGLASQKFSQKFSQNFSEVFSETFWGAWLAWGWPGKIFSGLILGVHNKHPPLRSRAETTSHMAPAASADPRTILEISGKSWRLFPAG